MAYLLVTGYLNQCKCQKTFVDSLSAYGIWSSILPIIKNDQAG